MNSIAFRWNGVSFGSVGRLCVTPASQPPWPGTLGLQKVRAIYRAEGIAIDLWKTSARIRAVYLCEGGDPSVLVNRPLPKVPRLFAMVHELKHHYRDQTLLKNREIRCGDYNANELIEKAAEVFAAEFIYPEEEFLKCVKSLGFSPGKVTPESVVELKRACEALVSYKFLQKRLEWFDCIESGEFAKVKFQKLEDGIYGAPIYRQPWFKVQGTAAPVIALRGQIFHPSRRSAGGLAGCRGDGCGDGYDEGHGDSGRGGGRRRQAWVLQDLEMQFNLASPFNKKRYPCT